MVGTASTTATSSGIFSYFFQAGFGLMFGLSVVAIPAWRLAKGEKLFNFKFGRRKY